LLNGIYSPHQNRTIPPLKYHVLCFLERRFLDVDVILVVFIFENIFLIKIHEILSSLFVLIIFWLFD